MKTPIILLAGKAGTGKDTIANLILEYRSGIKIAHSDLMKRFCKKLFEFSDEQLWGSSEFRDQKDTSFSDTDGQKWKNIYYNWEDLKDHFGIELLERTSLKNPRIDVLGSWLTNMASFSQTHGYLSPRIALQQLGTEYGRFISQNVWSEFTLSMAQDCLNNGYGYSNTEGLLKNVVVNPSCVVITDGRFRNEIVNVNKINGTSVLVHESNPKVVNSHASEKDLDLIPKNWFDFVFFNDKKLGHTVLGQKVKLLLERMKCNNEI